MKNKFRHIALPLSMLAVIMLLFSGCIKDTITTDQVKTFQTITLFTPVYLAKSVALAGLNGQSSQAIEQAGKIYIKDNYIYLNDVNKGIHIIDNSNPSSPAQVAFLSIPGNTDIAVKGNILYADMYSDLLAIDISDPKHALIRSTLQNFFTGRNFVNGQQVDAGDQLVVDWIKKDTTVQVSQYYAYPNCNACLFNMASGTTVPSNASASTGTAGSMAGMVLIKDHLFAITEMHSLGIVDITNAATPKQDTSFFAGYDLQTIFPFEDKLFLGSAIGMFMYDVSDPQHPVSLGQFTHGRACDPVITDGHFAYVTLHAGDGCGGDANELNVIDINDLQHTQLVKTYPFTKPTGLGKDGDLLFICDSTAVKVYNAAKPADLQLLQEIPSNSPYDIIAANNRALVVCNNGLYQYDYSDLQHVRLLSFFATAK